MAYTVDNVAGVDPELIRAVVDATAIRPNELLLLIGEPSLDHASGICVPRSLIKEARCRPLLARKQLPGWQCGVILSKRTCDLVSTHLGFFVYVLAHELGHARVALADPSLHVYCCFIENALPSLTGCPDMALHELPHERAHDQFGMAIAGRLLGRARVEHDFAQLLTVSTRSDHARLRFALDLVPSTDQTNLRTELADVARQCEHELYRIWDQNVAGAASTGQGSITENVDHIRNLFHPPS